MRRRFALFLGLVLIAPAIVSAQTPPKKGNRLKNVAAKLLDTAATSAASVAADSLLGTSSGAAVAGYVGGGASASSAVPTCSPGQVLYLVAFGAPSGAQAVGMPGVPSAGSMLVGAARKRLSNKPTDSAGAMAAAAPAAVPSGPQYACGTAEEATASMQAQQQAQQAQQAQNAGAQSGAPGGAGAVLGATPAGMLVTGAVAVAPMAMKGAKALGNRFGLTASVETMIRDLARGRLRLKGIKFVEGTDAVYPGFENEIAMLAEALQTVEGQFVLNVPAEGDGKSEPDTAVARRRIMKVWTQMQAGGIPPTRLIALGAYPSEYDAKRKPPKRGESRVEILRMPTETKP